MSPIRLAIIGLNHYHVCGWADTLRNLKDVVEVVGIYDSDPGQVGVLQPQFQDPSLPQSLADEYKTLPFYSDLPELIREQRPHAALVMDHHVRNPGHVEILAQAGIHAFLDKSGACNAADLARAMQSARRAGLAVGAGLTWRLSPPVQKARELIRDGKLGSLMGAEISMVSSTVQARDPQNHLFKKRVSGGGFVHWLHIHFIDALMHLAGRKVVSVQAMAANVGGAPIDVEDVAAAALELEGGAIGVLFGGYLLPRWVTESHLRLHGSKLSLEIQGGLLQVLEADQDRRPLEVSASPKPSLTHKGYGGHVGVQLIRDWLQATEDPAAPLSSSGDDLVRALAVIDAIYTSSQSGRRTCVREYS